MFLQSCCVWSPSQSTYSVVFIRRCVGKSFRHEAMFQSFIDISSCSPTSLFDSLKLQQQATKWNAQWPRVKLQIPLSSKFVNIWDNVGTQLKKHLKRLCCFLMQKSCVWYLQVFNVGCYLLMFAYHLKIFSSYDAFVWFCSVWIASDPSLLSHHTILCSKMEIQR